MPRYSRNAMKNGFMHIMCQGINKEYIFNEEREIKKYLEILEKNQPKFNLEIIAYCVMNNHVHLLIYSEEIKQVSEFMRRINTSYAMYYNKKHERCGFVFRNRYRSEEIWTKEQLICCINYIHNNPVKANMCLKKEEYMYSSYKCYLKKEGLVKENVIQKHLIDNGISVMDLLENQQEDFQFIEYYEKNKNEKEVINNFLKKNNMKFEEIRTNIGKFKELILELKIKCQLNQTEIGELMGMNRMQIYRILCKKERPESLKKSN